MPSNANQLRLPLPGVSEQKRDTPELLFDNATVNEVAEEDKAIHDWYRFVLSFPPHLVRHYLDDFNLDENDVLLDPFCGTGTTLVEAKLNGIPCVGLEANPITHFASSVKLDWSINPEALLAAAEEVANAAREELRRQGLDDYRLFRGDVSDLPLRQLPPEVAKLLIKDSISPIPLHKTLLLMEYLEGHEGQPYHDHMLLALARALVFSIGNLRFGPEVGVGKKKLDSPVVAPWLSVVRTIVRDLQGLSDLGSVSATVHLADARDIIDVLDSVSLDAVITSPPYPNEKDYSRTTRLESVLLGFYGSMGRIRKVKKQLIRSNTRGVYKDDDDDKWIEDFPRVLALAEQIESRRKELGKTSGFERTYARVTRLYFGGMARHLSQLRMVLKPGARLAYVVGDQASYLRVMIRTGQILAEIAESLGYEVDRIDLFRTRYATATDEQLREEVVILRWPG